MKPLLILLSAILISAIGYGQSAFEYFSIGLVKYNLDDFTKAISDFDRAIEANPEYSEAYNLRGASKYNLGDYEGAIEDYTSAIEIDSRQSDGIGLTIYDQRGKVIESKRSVTAEPFMATPFYNRALARSAKDDYQGAIEDFNAALQMDPSLITAYYFMGELKYELGDLTGACSDWQKANDHGIAEAAELLQELCTP